MDDETVLNGFVIAAFTWLAFAVFCFLWWASTGSPLWPLAYPAEFWSVSVFFALIPILGAIIMDKMQEPPFPREWPPLSHEEVQQCRKQDREREHG